MSHIARGLREDVRRRRRITAREKGNTVPQEVLEIAWPDRQYYDNMPREWPRLELVRAAMQEEMEEIRKHQV